MGLPDRESSGGSFIKEIIGQVEKGQPIKPTDLRGFCEELKSKLVLAEVEITPEIRSSLDASQFRVKVGESGELLVYDRSKPEGERWIPLSEDGIEVSFCKGEGGEFADRAFAIFRLLGRDKFEALVRFAAQKG